MMIRRIYLSFWHSDEKVGNVFAVLILKMKDSISAIHFEERLVNVTKKDGVLLLSKRRSNLVWPASMVRLNLSQKTVRLNCLIYKLTEWLMMK